MNTPLSNDEARRLQTPSPLNGERVGVRGESAAGHPTSANVLAVLSVCRALHLPDVATAIANPPRWCRAQKARLSAVSSKTSSSRCFLTANARHGERLAHGAWENHADHHPVPSCSEPRHNRNPDSAFPLCVDGEICKPKNDGRAELPKASLRSKWIVSSALWRWSLSSRTGGVLNRFSGVKPLLPFPPLTLALSPMRGEGEQPDSLHLVKLLGFGLRISIIKVSP